MTDWLKKEADKYNPGRIYALMEDLNTVSESMREIGLMELADKVDGICAELDSAGAKEGSIFDNPEYQRQQENVGDSGDFDPSHVLDSRPKSDFTNDPGPASATPGAPGTSVAPGTGLAEGLFD